MAPDSSSRVTLVDLVVVAGAALESAYESSRQHATATSAPSPALLFAPLLELAKQHVAIGLAQWCTSSDAIQEGLKIATDVILRRSRRAVETREHLLGDNVPCPAWNHGTQIDVPPLWMTGRNQELVPIRKEPFGKTFDSSVSVATPWPVEH